LKGWLDMNKEKIIYGILCGIGGGLIGFFANKLNTFVGGGLFTLGIVLLVFSITKLNKWITINKGDYIWRRQSKNM